MKKAVFSFFLFLLVFQPLFSQSHPRGTILDNALYDSLPRKATQLTRGYENLPKSVSLKQFAPYPESQGEYGTCAAWATAYAARTIAESVALNRRDRDLTTSNVFSPAFVFKSVLNVSTISATLNGIAISQALDVMKNPGIPRRNNAERTGDYMAISLSSYNSSSKFPIAGYVTLYNYRRGEPGYETARVQAVKKSLAEGKPVIVGMNAPDSLDDAKSPWMPYESPNFNWGGHAMCVVGYDDAKYNGAFEVQNSWGDWWGEDGYIWITYDVFAKFADHAYEILENLDTYKDATLYSGFVEIEVDGSTAGMPVRFDEGGFYRTLKSYQSGTRFRFIMGNNHPAYVYAFTADSSTSNINLIFPLAELNESPVLDYSVNMVAWPGENDWIELDNVKGTDYLVVLYSKRELDIGTIMARFRNAQGSFPQRAANAVGPDYVSHSNVKYDESEISFTGTMVNRQAVMGLLLVIDHN